MTDHFVAVKIHSKERPQDFGRFRADLTPTLILSEADGTERHRIIGYLPALDFLAQLRLGLGKAAFSRSRFEEAQQAFESVVSHYPQTEAAPEAVYWAGVSAYKATKNRVFLNQAGARLRDQYPGSDWAKKGSAWLS